MNTSAPDTTVTPLRDETGDSPAWREPPHNAEIEAALLGAVLTNNRAFENLDFLEPEHFYEPAHQRIYEAAGKLIERGQVASPATLKHYFDADEALEEVGGGAYLFDLVANAPTLRNSRDYAATIHDLWLRRELIALGQTLVDDAYRLSLDTSGLDLRDGAQAALDGLAGDHVDSGPRPVGDASARALATTEAARLHGGEVTGIATGLSRLDRLTGGLHRGEVMLLAGRPSMGKTGLAGTIAWNVAEQGGRVAFFSLEMGDEQVAMRLHAGLAKVDLSDIRRGSLNDAELMGVRDASRWLSNVQIMIDETPELTLAALKARARRLKRRGLDLIVVDYVQLISPPRDTARYTNRTEVVGEISRGLKTLAKQLDVAVLALSQLSRQVESRDDKRPQLADLRDSGSLEQDADVVCFIYRHVWYVAKREPLRKDNEGMEAFNGRCDTWSAELAKHKGKAILIVAKQRQGPTGDFTVGFDERRTWFHDPDGDSRQEGMEL